MGIVAISGFTIATGTLLWFVLKHTTGIRVDAHEEMKGLDLSEHGQVAYAGFSMSAEEIAEAEALEKLT